MNLFVFLRLRENQIGIWHSLQNTKLLLKMHFHPWRNRQHLSETRASEGGGKGLVSNCLLEFHIIRL